MIRALISGELVTDPQQRTSRNGNPYALARVSVPHSDEGRIYCSVIVFEPDAVTRLLQLKAGASVAMAGALKVGIYEGKGGTARPSLDLQADEVASTTPRPRKAKESPPADRPARSRGEGTGEPFGDLPWADDVDWLGA